MTALRNHAGQFAKRRTPPPGLIVNYPTCPMCDKEVDHDGDSFACYNCAAYWDDRSPEDAGEWNEPDVPGCRSAIKPYDRPDLAPEHESIRHCVDACILEDDHAGPHQAADSWRKWTDDDPRLTS